MQSQNFNHVTSCPYLPGTLGIFKNIFISLFKNFQMGYRLIKGHSRNKRDSMSDSGGSDIMDLEEGTMILLNETPLTKKQNCSSRYNNNISNTNVFTVETDV
jgi:hypothetical protein